MKDYDSEDERLSKAEFEEGANSDFSLWQMLQSIPGHKFGAQV